MVRADERAHMTTVWHTSDLHVGHRMVAELRGFDDPVEHDAALADNWDAIVDKRDSVWILGDLCLQGTGVTNRALQWVSERPGTKHFVAGNHDSCHPAIDRNGYKWMRRYMEVFDSVQTMARRKIAGQNVLMSHFPYQGSGDHTFEERFTQYRLPDMGEYLLHGHIHSTEKVRGKMIHVGVDAHDLKPVPLDWIEEVIRELSDDH